MNGGEDYLSSVRKAVVEVIFVDPVLEITDPQAADLLECGRLVIGGGGRRCSGGPTLVVMRRHPLLLVRRIHGLRNRRERALEAFRGFTAPTLRPQAFRFNRSRENWGGRPTQVRLKRCIMLLVHVNKLSRTMNPSREMCGHKTKQLKILHCMSQQMRPT